MYITIAFRSTYYVMEKSIYTLKKKKKKYQNLGYYYYYK